MPKRERKGAREEERKGERRGTLLLGVMVNDAAGAADDAR